MSRKLDGVATGGMLAVVDAWWWWKHFSWAKEWEESGWKMMLKVILKKNDEEKGRI